MNQVQPDGVLEALLLTINSEPVAALLVGLLMGVLLATGRSTIIFMGKLLRSMKTGKWENGHDLHTLAAAQQQVLELQKEHKDVLAKIADHQAKNYQHMRELVAKQAEHDGSTLAELAKVKGRLDRIVDRLDK